MELKIKATVTLRRVPAMTTAEAKAFVRAHPMRAAVAMANVQYVLAEMAATSEGRAWTPL